MRFLIIGKSKYPIPPEMAAGIVDATMAWARKYTENGKIEQTWAFAGIPAGGGIFNVDSLEELDAVQSEFPMGPFSDQEVYPLVDLQGAMERMKQAIQAMAPPPGR